MKKLIFVLFLGWCCSSFASFSGEDSKQVYGFKFTMKGDKFEYTQKAASYEEAFHKAAQACFTHFKGGRRLAEEQGLDIIDVCANPRAI